MKLYAVKTRVIKACDNLVDVIVESLNMQNLKIKNGDVLALASKIVAYAENRMVKLEDVKFSERARKLAEKFSLSPEFAELILEEAEEIYGGVERAVLTLKNEVLTANAGIDNKNAPDGFAALWPNHAKEAVKHVREEIRRRTGKDIAVLIVDSRVTPLRMGTTGLALAVAGFKPVRDCRGERDIFGKSLIITRHAVADDLASAAHLLMGEAAEKTPVVLIRDAPVDFEDGVYGSEDMMISFDKCIFMGNLGVQREGIRSADVKTL